MTSPVNVGEVSVDVVASAARLAKTLRKDVEKAFEDLDVSRAIEDAVGKTRVKLNVDPVVDDDALKESVRKTKAPDVPVGLDPDTNSIPEKVRKTRVPKVPVELDPVLAAFQAEIRRQTNALAKQININVPVSPDTAGLRAELGAQLATIQAQSRVKISTEPGAKAEYEAKLRALVDAASARVKATVKVEPKVSGVSDAAFSGVSGIFKGLIPDIGGAGAAVRGLADGVRQFASVAAQGGSTLATSIAGAAGPIGTVISLLVSAGTAMGALGTAAIFVVPALSAVAGAAAAIPAALAGIGAAFGALSLGFKGIAGAFAKKPAGGGGGGGAKEDPAERARRIAAAERGIDAARRGIAASTRGLASAERGYQNALQGVADAQARYKASQKAVNQARKEAIEDIDDLGRALRGAVIDEKSARLGVDDSLRALNEAKLTGNLPDIQRAEIAYEQAVLTLDNATDSVGDLGEEAKESAKKGVEGSDKVQNALADQADAYRGIQDAQEGVIDAQDALLSANDSLKSSYDGLISANDALLQAQKKTAAAGGAGGGGAIGNVVKLAPAAQKFVDAIKALKPAFEDLRLDVQQRLFEGLDKTVTHLGEAWIDPLKKTLGSYADTFNQFFKNLGSAISTPKFITDIQAGAEGFRKGFVAIGDSVTKSLVPAFGALSKAAAPFIESLGKEIAGIVTQFSNWVLQGEKTKGLNSFFDRAAKALHSIFTTGKLVGSIIGDLFSIIIGGQAKSGNTPIDTFNNALSSLDKYLRDPAHQQQIRDFIQQLADTVNGFAGKIKKISDFLGKLGLGDSDTQGAKDKSSDIGADIGRALVAGLIAGIGEAMKASLKAVFFLFTGTDPSSFIGGLKDQLGIHSPSTVMADIGHDVVNGFLQGIADKFKALQTRAGQIRTTVTTALGNAASWLTAHGQNVVIGLGNGIVAQFKNLSARAQGMRTTVSNAVSNAGSWLYSHGQAVIYGMEKGIQSFLGNLGQFAGNARVYVQNAMRNAGDWLRSHGRAVIIGLANGIIDQIPGLGSILSYVTDFIRAHKGPIEKDRTLLTPAGQAIMDGLIGGIGDKRGDLAAELAAVTGLIADTPLSELGVAGDTAINRALSVASSSKLEASWAAGATADPLLAALRSLIQFKYRNDPVAALTA